MCGVVAYATQEVTKAQEASLIRLFRESKIRGLHACGISWLSEGRLLTAKFHEVPQLTALLEGLLRGLRGRPLKLIGHTRYSTSGDWADHANNQPLNIKAGPPAGKTGELPDVPESAVSLVFNGCIHMGLRSEYEALYGREYVTDNDGEIFCRKVLDGEDWERFVAEGSFSFAGTFIYQGKLVVMRNRNRPLWTCTEDRAVFVASTADICRRAQLPGELQEVEPCKAQVIIV